MAGPLRHLHIPGLTSYTYAGKLQDRLVRALLNFKKSPSTLTPPHPTIITAEVNPVYTCGRREIGTVSAEQQRYLRQGLGPNDTAEFHEALRGGQTTFHGPGQLVAYPVIDLKRHKLSARCYVDLLEEVVINTCEQNSIHTMRTSDPGVWVDESSKICALGVHLRRNVSSHGIGLNVTTDLRWFDRIVACGLEGKRATNFLEQGVDDMSVEGVGELFVRLMVHPLHDVDSYMPIKEHDLEQGT